jgi:hypothetical protein
MLINRYFVLGALVLSVLATSVVVACSSDDTGTSSSSSSGGSSSGGQTEETVTVHVSAAAGGSVADKDGKAKLDIPAGALEKDTDITLKLTAKSGAAVIEIADFGPDGLKFLKPATLEFKADSSLAPAGKSLAVAMEEGGTFKALTGSTYANGVAKAPVEHFTKFSVVVIDGFITLVDPSSCQDARAQFTPCGGDPVGTWTFAEFCLDPNAIKVPDPFQGKCTGYVGSAEVIQVRDVTITSSTVAVSAGTNTIKFVSDFPLQCIVDATDGGVTQCGDYGGSENPCTDKGGGQCHCESTQVENKEAEAPAPYTTSGSTWTSDDGNTGKYCVSGDVLYYLSEAGDAQLSNLLYVLKRK